MNNIYFCKASEEHGEIEYLISAPSDIVCKSLIANDLIKNHWYILVSDEEIDEGTEKTIEDLVNMFGINMMGVADEKFNTTGIIYYDSRVHYYKSYNDEAEFWDREKY